MKLRAIALVFAAASLLLLAGVIIYGARVWLSAQALLDSASGIRSTSDAQREIAVWRNRSGRGFHETISPDGRERSFNIQVENGLLHRLYMVPPTMMGTSITMRDGELRSLVVVMFSGRPPNPTSGVWIQEWFGSNAVVGFHVNGKDRPWKATVEFGQGIPLPQREKTFAMDLSCFVRPRGCPSAERILPGIWQLQ